jgi:uncharacterized membrane protein HdeD (DUF308 family)
MLTITPLLQKIDRYILNPLIVLLFVIGLAFFIWGVVQLIANPEDTKGEGKQNILWGIIGMFIMISVMGIIRVILATFGIPNPPFIF